MQPGQTITPGSDSSSTPPQNQTAPVLPPVQPVAPPQSYVPQAPPAPVTQQAAPVAQPRPEVVPTEQQYDTVDMQFSDADDDIELTWTASEFVNREKSPAWYGILAGVTLSVSALVFVLTKDITASVMIVVAALAFGILAARKPRVQRYEVHSEGILINQQFHAFADYRAFSIVDEGAVRSIIMLPLRRFGMGLTLYSPPDIEDSVYEAIGSHLPFLENYSDPLDSVLRKLHF